MVTGSDFKLRSPRQKLLAGARDIIPLIVGAILMAGIVAVLANELPHKLGLMVAAIAGITAGFWLETHLSPPNRVARR